jgi:hypothetical protein
LTFVSDCDRLRDYFHKDFVGIIAKNRVRKNEDN